MRARASKSESQSDKERESEREIERERGRERKREKEREREREQERKRERADEMRVCCKQVGDIKVSQHPHLETRESVRGGCQSKGGATRGAMHLDFTFDAVPCSCAMFMCDVHV